MKKLILTLSLLFTMLAPQVSADTIRYATVFSPTTGVRKAVVIGDPYAFAGDKKSPGGYLLETSYNYIMQEPGQLGFSVVTNYKTTLSRSISSTASTIYVSSLTTKDGHVLTMADLGSKVFFTLEPGSNKEEIIMCTGVGTLSWTGATRGLAFYATSTAAVTANQKSHSAGSAIVMSNVHYVYDELVDKDSADTIAGDKTFTGNTVFNEVPALDAYEVPVADGDLAPKKYVDDTISSGAPDATATVKGIVELATGAEAAAGASAGGTTGGLVLPASIATTTANVAGNHVAITDTDGKLKQDLLDLTENWTFSGNLVLATSTQATSTINSLTLASTTITKWPTASTSLISRGYLFSEAYTHIIANPDLTDLQKSSDAATTTRATAYAKIKEFTWTLESGNVTTYFCVYRASGSGTVYGKIYKNGVAAGAEGTDTDGSANCFSDNLTFATGDLIQVYAYSNYPTNTNEVSNFRLYFSKVLDNQITITETSL